MCSREIFQTVLSLFYEHFHIWLSYALWEINQPQSIFLKLFLNFFYLYYTNHEVFSLNLFQLFNMVSAVSLWEPLWFLSLGLYSQYFTLFCSLLILLLRTSLLSLRIVRFHIAHPVLLAFKVLTKLFFLH